MVLLFGEKHRIPLQVEGLGEAPLRANHGFHRSILQDVLQPLGGVLVVERHVGSPALQGGQYAHDHIRTAMRQQTYPVVWAYSGGL